MLRAGYAGYFLPLMTPKARLTPVWRTGQRPSPIGREEVRQMFVIIPYGLATLVVILALIRDRRPR